jgi:hypothetical protein
MSISILDLQGKDDSSFNPDGTFTQGTDNYQPLASLIAANPVPCMIHLPFSQTGFYYLSDWDNTGVSLAGYTLDPEPGVVIVMPVGKMIMQPNTAVTRPLKLRILSDATGSGWYEETLLPSFSDGNLQKSIFLTAKDFDQSSSHAINAMTELSHFSFTVSPASEIVTDIPSAVSENVVTWVGTASKFVTSQYPSSPGADVSWYQDCSITTARIGACIKFDGGYFGIYRGMGSSPLSAFIHYNGSTQTVALAPFTGYQTNAAYFSVNADWCVHVFNDRTFSVLLNRAEIYWGKLPGDIQSAGPMAGIFPAGTYNARCLVSTKNKLNIGKRRIVIWVVGDSCTTPLEHSNWPIFMQEAINQTGGARCEVRNLAIGGAHSSTQLASLLQQTMDPMDLNAFVAYIGVNNIQSQDDLAAYISDVRAVLALFPQAPKVIAIPSMFYSRNITPNANHGVIPQNYDKGAAYRQTLRYEMAKDKVKIVDLCETRGPVMPSWIGGCGDPVVRDNIHETRSTARNDGYAIARAVMGAWNPED